MIFLIGFLQVLLMIPQYYFFGGGAARAKNDGLSEMAMVAASALASGSSSSGSNGQVTAETVGRRCGTEIVTMRLRCLACSIAAERAAQLRRVSAPQLFAGSTTSP